MLHTMLGSRHESRIFGMILAVPVLASAAFTEERPAARSLPRPNVVLISIDTLRPDHLSTYGYDRETSPALTGIARDGVRFDRAFSQAPWTIPSHASLLTGRYPCGHGANTRSAAIPETVPLLAELLGKAGYRTAGFVSAPYLGSKFGFARGFEVYENPPTGLNVFKWLDTVGGDPFFVFIHIMSVRGPYKGRPDVVKAFLAGRPSPGAPDSTIDFLRGSQIHEYLKLERYESLDQLVADYDAGILAVDERIATIVDDLRRRGLYDRTMIIVTSDHGESLFDHRIYVGHGVFLYDDEVRIPLIIKPAWTRPPRAVVDDVVQSVDVMPTVLAYTAQPIPHEIDGESLQTLIRTGKAAGVDGFAIGISSSMGDMAYLRTDRWKYISPAGHSLEKVVGFFKPSAASELASRVTVGEQLFDLSEDPGELTNVVSAHPGVAARMRAQLKEILLRCGQGGAVKPGAEVELDEEELKRLKALGYVD